MNKFLVTIIGLSLTQASMCSEKPFSSEAKTAVKSAANFWQNRKDQTQRNPENPYFHMHDEDKAFVPHRDFPSGTRFNPLFRTSAESAVHSRKYSEDGGDHPFVLEMLKNSPNSQSYRY